MNVIVVNAIGAMRILDGVSGMTFIVDKTTDAVDGRGKVAHVRDYRVEPYQIWSIGPEGYSFIEE